MAVPNEPIRRPIYPYDESASTYGMAWLIGMYRGKANYWGHSSKVCVQIV